MIVGILDLIPAFVVDLINLGADKSGSDHSPDHVFPFQACVISILPVGICSVKTYLATPALSAT